MIRDIRRSKIERWGAAGMGFMQLDPKSKNGVLARFDRTKFVCSKCLSLGTVIVLNNPSSFNYLQCTKGCFNRYVSTEFVHLLCLLCDDAPGKASAAIEGYLDLPVTITSGGYDGYDFGFIPVSEENLELLRLFVNREVFIELIRRCDDVYYSIMKDELVESL